MFDIHNVMRKIRALNFNNYLVLILTRVASVLSLIFSLWGKKKINFYGSQPLKHQPVFIVGAPRTGSTIFYQTLTNLYDVLYIDNFVCKFHRNIFLGFRLDHLFFKNKPHNNYQADHGNTAPYGLHAPSECGQFWYRWLPRDRHFIDFDEISDATIRDIRMEITAIINYFDKPIIFGNNNAGLRIRLLSQCFPGAKYIFIDRDPVSVACSLLNARKKFYGDYCKWWSILPANFKDLMHLPPWEQVVCQHYHINKQMLTDLRKFAKNNFFETKYDDICRDIDKMIDFIFERLCISPGKRTGNIVWPRMQLQQYSAGQFLKEVQTTVQRFDFNDYTS